jgi:hypothetical protein
MIPIQIANSNHSHPCGDGAKEIIMVPEDQAHKVDHALLWRCLDPLLVVEWYHQG